MNFHFRFDVEKATQAAAALLRRERSKRMNYMRLLNVLYVAEREALCENGAPITGARIIAMPRGPVMEDVLHLIRNEHPAIAHWSAFILRDKYDLELVADPGAGRLTRYQLEKLEEIATRYEQCDEYDMVKITHGLDEWKKNNPGESSRPIPLKDILDALGIGDRLESVIEDNRGHQLACEPNRSK